MGTMTLLPHSGPFTEDDLLTMPDDGRRYEVIDGTLVVTPAPARRHQRMVGELYLLLRAGCPADLEVLLTPYDVRLAADTVLQPDLLVAGRADTTERNLPHAPLLAVEVLSPSTRLVDLNLKRARYEQAGCATYWAVDPEVPAVTVWELTGRGSTFGSPRLVTGADPLEVERPFPLRLVPADLRG